MTLRLDSRFLYDVNSSLSSSSPSPDLNHVDSDFVVILAALLCALICVLGLVAVARCAWIRRIATANTTTSAPPVTIINKGLKKKALNSLPKLTYSPSPASCGKFSADCAICLAEFVSGDEIRLLPQCGHVFHLGCVDTWLKSNSSCPSCRVQILALDKPASTPTCHKCGELPPATTSSVAATGTGTAMPSSSSSARQDHEINRFLP